VVKQVGEKPIHRFPKEIIGTNLPEWDVDSLEKETANGFADWYSTIHCFENDIFVLRTGGRNGMVFSGKKGVTGATLYCLTPLEIETNYLYYFLKANEFEHSATRDLKPSFWEQEIPIPPIEEQKYIVKSIEEAYQSYETQNKEAERKLLDGLRKLVPVQSETLDNIIGLEDFKKAVLDLAMSGGLLNNSKFDNYRIEDISTKIQYGFTSKALKQNTSVKFLRITDIQNSKVEWGKVPFCEISDDLVNDYLLSKDDILFARIGATVGKSFIIEDEVDKCIFASYLIRVQLQKTVNAKYVYLFFQSTQYWKQIKSLQADTTLPVVNGSKLANIKISLPSSPEEQAEIVNIVENIFAEAEKIQQDFEAQKKQQDNLLKSIIHNTFFQPPNFAAPQNDWDLDALIKAAREKKEKEIYLLRQKQMAKKKEEASKPKQDILSLLKEAGTALPANDLLEQSKFEGNIDDFFAEVKRLVNGGLVKWHIDKETQEAETPLSMLTLIKQHYED